MRTRPATRHPDQARAFADSRVVEIAAAITEHPVPGLPIVARRAMLGPWELDQDEVLNIVGRQPEPHVVDAAGRIAKAGAGIAGEPDPWKGRLMGAVLERIVWELVSERATVEREHEVELKRPNRSGRDWARALEVIVNGDPFEAFECKVSARRFNQADIDELLDIDAAAGSEGLQRGGTLAVLDSAQALIQARLGWDQGGATLRFADIDDMVGLVRGPARRLLA